MVNTSPRSIRIPLPARSVPSVPAVKASGGMIECSPTTADSARSRSKLKSSARGWIAAGTFQAVDADPFDHRTEVPRIVRLVDRLGGEPEMLADIFGRLALQMRHLAAKTLEMLVHPPRRRSNPAEAAFDEHDLQLRKALRDPL